MNKRKIIALSVALALAVIAGCSAQKESVNEAEITISEIAIEKETADTQKIDSSNETNEQTDRIEEYLENIRPYGMFIQNDIIGLLIEDYDANMIVITDGKGNVLNKTEIPFKRSVYYESCEAYKTGIVLHGKSNAVCFFDISTMELREIDIPDDIVGKIDVHNLFTYVPERNAIAYASDDGGLYAYENGKESLLYQGDISDPNSFIPCDVKGTYDQKRLMVCGYINNTDPHTGHCYKCIGVYNFETQKMEWKKSNAERMISTPNADIFCLSPGGSLAQGEETGEVHIILPTEEFTVKMDSESAENIIDYIPASESFLCAKKLEGGKVYLNNKEGQKKSVEIGYDCPDLLAVNDGGSVMAGTAIVYDEQKEEFTSVLYLNKLEETND